MLHFILAWVPMVFIAIANGVVRDLTYSKWVGDHRAHQVSTLTGIVLFGLYIWAVVHFLGIGSATQAWVIGLLWLAMTIAFEFLFGHYIAKHSWSDLLADYNLLQGRLWVLVLVWVALAPWIFFKLG